MTGKQLENIQLDINNLVWECAKRNGLLNNANPIYDGIADEEAYLKSGLKIAWVLKEPWDEFDQNGKPCGGGWSIVKDCFLRHDENWVDKSGRKVWTNPVFQKVAYTMYGFQNGKHWDDMEWIRNKPSMMDVLKSVAWINLSKMPAYKCSSNGSFGYYFEQVWKEVVFRQLQYFSPDVIIFGRTFTYFMRNYEKVIRFSKEDVFSNDWAKVLRVGKQYWIDTYHPGRKGGEYVDSLIKALVWIQNTMEK